MMLTVIQYIKRRLNERSTYIALSAAALAGSALSPPWSYVGAVAAFMAALLPDGPVKGG